jgi:hypothetical protein
MNYVYHRVPSEMKGDILYPLNEIKNMYPEMFEKEARKYEGREHIMNDVIPRLNCLWNDVLHFSPVPIIFIKTALAELGKDFHAEYFKVPAVIFNPEKTVIYLNGEIPKMDPSNWLPYDSAQVSQYAEMPESTKKYYREKLEKNEQPLLYAKIPHILYKGSIDTKNLERVRV